MFTISASRLSVRFVALITVVSLILSAFPASFFVAFAQENPETPVVDTPIVEESIVEPAAEEEVVEEEVVEEAGLFEQVASFARGVVNPKKVTICKATASQQNPYNQQSVNENSLAGGHGQNGINENDIVPPTDPYYPNGHNWNSYTESIFENGCTIPKPKRCESNLLLNGSFEEPTVTAGEKWQKFAAVAPWNIAKVADATPTTLELMRGWNGNVAAHGEQYAELDGDQSTKIAQTAATLVGGTYELSWAFAARHNIDAVHNNLSVSIDGTEVATNGPTTGTSPLSAGSWQYGTKSFVATNANTVIEFADLGVSDSYGTFLDDAQLCLTKEPPKPKAPEVCSLTGKIVSATTNPVKSDSSPVDPTRRSVAALDTVASYSTFGFKDGNSFNNADFFTLGVNGFVTYEFTDKVAIDQAGPDIAIWEITGGNKNQLSTAKATVAVSQDGVTFVSAGSITGDGLIDIGSTGLDYVKFVKVTDDSSSIGNDDGGDGYDVDAITIIDGSCSDTATIVAEKIVCTNEAELPNRTGGSDITSTTAADWVAANTSCKLVADWNFEWADGHVANPGDSLTGAAGSPWTTFGPTDSTGKTSITLANENLGNGKISLREVLKPGYIPFTHETNSDNSATNTAEFYCASDVVNYDNLEYITVEADTTYHCVAWNVEKPKPTSCDLTIVSDTATVVEETNLNAVATYSGNSRWTANIPGATWIWEVLQVINPAVDTTRTFVETFTITNPAPATLTLAADNGYQVYLNGSLVVDNITVENNYEAGTQDVIPLTLVSGANELKVVVKNFGLINSTFASNPAGARYKLTATGTENCDRTTAVKTSGPVTMCKVDANERPLSGWTLTLLGNKVEDVVVPTNTPAGINTVSGLSAGKSYVAKVSGTWNNQGGANPADAEYSTTDGWVTKMDGYTGYSTDILELQINSAFDPASNWGAYNSAHTYARAFTQAATGSANFRIFDGESGIQNEGWFGDNSGTLNVSVYEGFAGITGQNGCVTFQNVPYGTYTTGEIMQDNWENVSGIGEAAVSQANDDFTIVNRYVPKYTESSETIVVNSNTASGENQPGWLFGRDLSTATPFAFSAGNAKIGSGSLAVAPIVNTTNSDKFIAEYFFLNTIDSLKSFTADFLLNASTSPAAANQFYLNVYANFGTSSPTKFYDCRYDVVATVASVSGYTTITFDPTVAYPVTTRGGASASPFACPAIPADMDTLSSGSVIRAIAINIGDTSGSDTGVGGYLDNVVVKTENDTLLQKKTTTFDFEPVRVVEEETFTVSGYKYECFADDGEYYCSDEDGIEGWLITATQGTTSTSTRTNEDGYYSFDLPAGEWTISEETQEDWEQIEVIENGEEVDNSVCELAVGLKKPTFLERTLQLVWEPSYTCDFGNYYDEGNGDGGYTDIISGFKWNDLDGNGTRGEGEPTIAGWVIGLYDGDLLVATTSTNGAGYYEFEVGPGEYTVAEVQQSGWTQTGTLRNNIPQLSFTGTCTFYVYEYELSKRLDESTEYEYEDYNTCDFGNQQDEVIEVPEQPSERGSRSSGTRTRAPQGQVLGATTQCGLWLEDYMQKATENDTYQVLKLQVFLNLQGYVTPLTGIFGTTTEANVKLFQTKYFDEIIKPWFERGIVPHNRPTGFVYKTTRWKINDIMCPGIEPYPSFEGENLTTNVLLNR